MFKVIDFFYFSGLAIWISLFGVIEWERRNLETVSSSISIKANTNVAYVLELTEKIHSGVSMYLVSYRFSDSEGLGQLAQEVVPYGLYSRLRVGDSLEIYSTSSKIFGKFQAVSRIRQNPILPRNLTNLARLVKVGLLVYLVFGGLLLVARVLELRPQKYL